MSQILTTEQQINYLGKVFQAKGLYTNGFARIVGYTAKRVIVQPVPQIIFTLYYDDGSVRGRMNGECRVDQDWLDKNPINNHQPVNHLEADKDYKLALIKIYDDACYSDDDPFFMKLVGAGKYGDRYYLVNDLNETFTCLDYD